MILCVSAADVGLSALATLKRPVLASPDEPEAKSLHESHPVVDPLPWLRNCWVSSAEIVEHGVQSASTWDADVVPFVLGLDCLRRTVASRAVTGVCLLLARRWARWGDRSTHVPPISGKGGRDPSGLLRSRRSGPASAVVLMGLFCLRTSVWSSVDVDLT